jgi:CubicO group peptidase (beta-lactamase class C family)
MIGRLAWMVIALMAVAVPKGARAERTALPRSAAETQGVSSRALLAFVEAADKLGVAHSFMLVRHGHVVAEGFWEPYERDTVHEVYSVTKSFTSTAVGLALSEGKLSLATPVLEFFPEYAPSSPSKHLRAMRVKDLLTMTTGQSESSVDALRSISPEQSQVQRFLAQPVTFPPGTHFVYNSTASHVLSAIVQKVTGQNLRDYLSARLFEPLGIELPPWAATPDGVTVGSSGLSLRTEDLAKFAELYLRKGSWRGQQLVPAEWIAAATSRQVSTGPKARGDWARGYGYQFWRSTHGFRADGAFGQFALVLPEHDAVVVINSGTDDMQALLQLVWDKLLPALAAEALAPDEANVRKLEARLATLMLAPRAGPLTPSEPERFSGKRYVFSVSDGSPTEVAVAWNAAEKLATLTLLIGDKEPRIACRSGRWIKSRVALFDEQAMPLAASCAWESRDTLAVRLRFLERTWHIDYNLKFEPKQLRTRETRKYAFFPLGPFDRVGQPK